MHSNSDFTIVLLLNKVFFLFILYKSSAMSLTDNSLCDTRMSEGGANVTRHGD